MITLDNIRETEYKELKNIQFLAAACVSLIPQRAVKKLKDFIDYCSRNDEESSSIHHINMDMMRQKAYQETAKLLNADYRRNSPCGIHYPRPEHCRHQLQA